MLTHVTHEHLVDAPSASRESGTPTGPKRSVFGNFAALLRFCGAATLVTSMVVFMFQEWSSMDDMLRYLSLLGFSGILSLLGFATSRWLNDNTGARLLLGMSLAAATTTIAIAGSLVYTATMPVPVPSNTVALPPFNPLMTGVAACIGAMLVIPPITWIAFRALAGSAARQLWKPFMALGALVLIPVRDSEIVIPLVSLAAAALAPYAIGLARRNIALGTLEGRFAQLLMVAPLLVLISRQLLFYMPGDWILVWASAAIYLAVRMAVNTVTRENRVRYALEPAGLVAVLAIAGSVTDTASAAGLGDVFLLPLFGMLAAVLSIDYAHQALRNADTIKAIAGYSVVASFSLNGLFHASMATALVTSMMGGFTATWAVKTRHRGLLYAGLAMVVLGLVYNLCSVLGTFDFGSAASLAACGLLTVLVASVVERYGVAIRHRIGTWRDDVAAW